MSTLELKEKLIKRIGSVDDDNLLKELLHLIEWESGKEKVYKIPEEHKAGIREGVDQIRSGKTKSHKEVINLTGFAIFLPQAPPAYVSHSPQHQTSNTKRINV